MKTRETHPPLLPPLLSGSNSDLPDHAALAALRAWYAGVPTREAVVRYLPGSVWQGRSARRGMRHTHATHALKRGAQLTSVRDNLRHASISTTSIYLHSDEVERARQFRDAFKAG